MVYEHGDRTGGSPPSPLFLHDFVAVDVPLDQLVEAFGRACHPGVMAAVVLESWAIEAEAAEVTGRCRPLRAPITRLDVEFGTPRMRHRSVVIPVSWRCEGNTWFPRVEADLELAEFGPRRSHLHLLGRFDLPPHVDRRSAEASMLERLTVAVVRHALDLLAERLRAQVRAGALAPIDAGVRR